MALAALLKACAPSVGLVTMSALVVYESGAQPYAIRDNSTRRSFLPRTPTAALQLATKLLSERHTIDLGYAQINSNNFRAYGLTAESALQPCTNLKTGSQILQADYARETLTYGAGQTALVHALSVYNTGDSWSGTGYAAGVYATAARLAGMP
jgi:type IV secretion system protein VirB1